MGNVVYHVRVPPIATIDGGDVLVEVKCGSEIFRFEGPVSVFVQTCAHFGEVARDWRIEQNGKVERIDHWRETSPG